MPGNSSQTAVTETRRLAAIMFTNMVDHSGQMGGDVAGMLQLLSIHNQLIQQVVMDHQGHVIKATGDTFLVDFPSVVHAVQCAQDIQAQLRTHNAQKESAGQIHVCIGIHWGDLIQRNGDTFGDGVNIASWLQGLAAPDTICLSQIVCQEVRNKLDLGTVVSLGKPKLKNSAERLAVYALLSQSPKGLRQALQVQWLKLSRRVGTPHRVAVGLVLLVGALTATWYLTRSPLSPQSSVLSPGAAPAALPLLDKPSILVLPFINVSSDPEQEYFSNGITEGITIDLSKISSVFVIARNSALTYKGKAVKVPYAGREMGARYVLEGTTDKAGDQVEITARLTDATTGVQLWSVVYDRSLTDIFAIQDEIAQHVVTVLGGEILKAELEQVRRIPTDNLTAHDTLLQGMEFWFHALFEMNKEANAQARRLFEHAIELDPNYAQAYMRLGGTYWLEWWCQWNSTPQTIERAGKLAQQAITLDDSLPEAHLFLGSSYLWQRQHRQAIAEAERAVALDPNGPEWCVFLGGVLGAAGRLEEGITMIERAMLLNPRFPVAYLLNLGSAYRVVGQYEKAIATAKQILACQPNFPPAYFLLAFSYAQLDRLDEARTAGAEFRRLNPFFSLESWKLIAPFTDPTLMEQDLAALRKAGLK